MNLKAWIFADVFLSKDRVLENGGGVGSRRLEGGPYGRVNQLPPSSELSGLIGQGPPNRNGPSYCWVSVIHVVTVHWHETKWVEIQLRALELNLKSSWQIYGALNGIDDPALRSRFKYGVDLPGKHPDKLNELAEVVIDKADPDDVLMFLDGDAFPIRPIVPWIEQTLGRYPLAAVRRSENLGDQQPHPCFCVTTVGFWRDLEGDWRPGGTWVNSVGDEVTDVGGNLLHQLRDVQAPWLPLLRTNTNNLHPLWFGVYDHKIYHHGAGFRSRLSRTDLLYLDSKVVHMNIPGPTIGGLRLAARRQPSQILSVRPRHISVLTRAAINTLKGKRKGIKLTRFGRQVERLSDEVFDRIVANPDFYREFDEDALD